jgi:Flp pilus assembly protein TadB
VSGRMKFAIAGLAVVGLILLFVNPWLGLVVIAAAIALPVGAYLMLDPSQRRRVREVRRRKQLGP